MNSSACPLCIAFVGLDTEDNVDLSDARFPEAAVFPVAASKHAHKLDMATFLSEGTVVPETVVQWKAS